MTGEDLASCLAMYLLVCLLAKEHDEQLAEYVPHMTSCSSPIGVRPLAHARDIARNLALDITTYTGPPAYPSHVEILLYT